MLLRSSPTRKKILVFPYICASRYPAIPDSVIEEHFVQNGIDINEADVNFTSDPGVNELYLAWELIDESAVAKLCQEYHILVTVLTIEDSSILWYRRW